MVRFKNILLIDDCEVDRYLLRRLVKKIKLGDRIVELENGREALINLKELADSGEDIGLSLVLVDINMPIMGGFEFLESFSKLRLEHSSLKHTKVVVMSSSETADDKKQASGHDFVVGYVPKSVESPLEFGEKIQALVA